VLNPTSNNINIGGNKSFISKISDKKKILFDPEAAKASFFIFKFLATSIVNLNN